MNKYLKNLNRIEFIVTLACTGKCKHCSEGDHTNCKGHIDADTAADAVRKICENYMIESLMTFGGEPLLYPEVVFNIHKTASSVGIPKRQVITNGFFSKKNERIEEVVHGLAESGVNDLLLSVDAFHQETIPIGLVRYFAECAVKAKIPIRLSCAWLVSRDDDNPYNLRTREIVRGFEDLKIPLGEGNVIFPSGNALKYLSEYFDENVEQFSPYEDDPNDVRTISFSTNGDVSGGNVYDTDILEILKNYRPYRRSD